MKKRIKKIALIGFIIFLLMQCYQPARNVSYEQVSSSNFTEVYKVPKNVETILRTSCYDCHSNNTNYPLYSYVQPIRFFMDGHINDGKKELNFNEFSNYSKRKQKNKLDRIAKEIKENEMPLNSYTLIHKNAVLSNNQKDEVINWINTLNKDE
ncbi:MAG TPA: heme-binding domain-containing protein [Flavobacterium sp.]|uniref:heme-binding domain-containing protein n=1 Tax=Flavobacterium sp. TaxID=239 RepID=UPI002CE02854|nr:heme-binding domain-containing protein [Flavobacterium sp.]HNP32325.1 heme-binding domain-containing protein [Flavobacterium sp.]